MRNPLELIDKALFLASGQDGPHSSTITELCEMLETTLRHYAAAADAVDFAHSEGFEWPHDPYGELALTFADMDGAAERLAQVGRSAKRQDGGTRLGPKGEHAVPKGCAP